MQKIPDFWLNEAAERLTPDEFDELVGELWLRREAMDSAAASGRQIPEILEYEIRRARALLNNPENRVRSRPHRHTFVADPKTFDRMKIRRKW